MNQQQQTGIDPLLLGGITKATHLRNIKNKAPTPTFKKWLDRQYEYIGEARTADDEKAGSAIRKNKRKSKNAQGNECGFVVRLLGSGNKALGITIGDETVSVFPQTTFIKARNCLEALVSAVRNDQAIFNEVASQLEANGYEDIPNFDEIDVLMA
jgi:hypothetical protein